MNGLPYYKAYPRDFIDGTVGMAFELKATYRLVLDLIYLQGGRLPDDARYIAGLMGCSVRAWNKNRLELISRGKITVENGFISNFRADKELETLRKLQENNAEKASKPRKNKDLQEPQQSQRAIYTDTDTDKRDTDVSLALSAPEPSSPISEAVEIYNDAASQVGWPKVQKLTPARAKVLKARLAECGGVEGWRIAMDKGKSSDFLSGRATGSTPANFDWITKQANFTKLMEGNYDNRNNRNRHNAERRENRPDPALENIFRLAGLGKASGNGCG